MGAVLCIWLPDIPFEMMVDDLLMTLVSDVYIMRFT